MPPTQNLPLALSCWLISTMAPRPHPAGKTLTLQSLALAFRFSKGGFLLHIRFLEILCLPQIPVQPLQGMLRASQRDGIFLASCIHRVAQRPLAVMLGACGARDETWGSFMQNLYHNPLNHPPFPPYQGHLSLRGDLGGVGWEEMETVRGWGRGEAIQPWASPA